MEAIRVRVRLFGAFRKYSERAEVALDVPRGTTVAALRRHLGEALRAACPGFADQPLLDISALADDERILDDAHLLGGDRLSLAVLPPVCGG
jgi:molybdopterin converting factor small subunit